MAHTLSIIRFAFFVYREKFAANSSIRRRLQICQNAFVSNLKSFLEVSDVRASPTSATSNSRLLAIFLQKRFSRSSPLQERGSPGAQILRETISCQKFLHWSKFFHFLSTQTFWQDDEPVERPGEKFCLKDPP